jgi:hypothetical protein
MDPGPALGIDRQRADKRQAVKEANPIVGAWAIGCRSQPREPGLLDGWVDQEEGLKLLHLVCRESVQKSGFCPLSGNGTAAEADLLERRIWQEKNSAAAQLIHDGSHDR